MAAPVAARLHARRLRADIRVPRDHPAPERVRSELADEVASRVPRALAGALTGLLRADDSGVWLIRRLDVDVHLRRGDDVDVLAKIWAREIAAALRRVMDGVGDPANVVRFRSRAEQTAAFLTDLLAGRARGCWYHRAFAGVDVLPVSAAIRTVLERDRGIAVEALALLTEPARRALVATSSEADAERLAQLLLAGRPGLARRELLDVLGGAFRRWSTRALLDGESRDRLSLVLGCVAVEPRALDARLAPLMAALVRMRRRIALSAGPDARTLAAAVSTGDVRAVAEHWDGDDLPVILPLLSEPRDWLEPLVLKTAVDAPAHPTQAAKRARVYTPFGGGALLLTAAAELPWAELPAPESPSANLSPQAWLRFLAVLEALGTPAERHGLDDPVLRTLYGIDDGLRRPTAPAGRASAPRPEVAAGQRLLRAFAAPLRGFAHASDDHLRRNFLDVGAHLEADDDRWLVGVGRAPLHVILQMAGLDRRDLWVPWLERTVAIFPDEAA
jgi:hypothetical protein